MIKNITKYLQPYIKTNVILFSGMAHAINRGEQSVTIKQAVEFYTRNAAFVMRQEKKVTNKNNSIYTIGKYVT